MASLQTWAPAKYRQRRPRRTGQSLRSKCICLLAPWLFLGLGTDGFFFFIFFMRAQSVNRTTRPSQELIESPPCGPTLEGGATALVLASHFRGSLRRF